MLRFPLFIIISLITITVSIAQTKIYVIDDRNDLYLFKPNTCDKSLIGNTGIYLADIAYNPIDSFLYGISDFGIAKINPLTANIEILKSLSIFSNSLTCDKNGLFYGCANNRFYTYDLITDLYSFLPNSNYLLNSAGDMTFLNGEIVLSASYYMIAQDPNSVTSTIITKDNVLSNAYGMCSVNEGCNTDLYIFSGSEVYKMNPETFTSEFICNIGISVYGSASTTESVDSKHVNLFSNKVICETDTTLIELNSRVVGASYLWQDGSTNATFLTNKPGKYWVTIHIDSCTNTDTIEIINNIAEKVNLGADRKVCAGEFVNIDLIHYDAFYVWSDNNIVSNWPIKTIYNPGKYWVNQTLNGCVSSDTILIEGVNLPQIDWSSEMYFCENDTLVLQAPIDAYCSYVWQDGSSLSSIKVFEQGQYWVRMHNEYCTVANFKSVNVLKKSNPSFILGNDTSICIPNTLTLSLKSNNGTFKWNDSSTTPTLNVSKDGIYWLTVTSTDQCTFTDSIKVNFLDCEVILTMPNIFTPNNDGLNEHFIPLEIKNIISAELKIFNRWGALIFSTFDLEKGWDGGGASDAVYYWSIDYVDINNKKDSLKSYLTLAR